MKRTKTIITTLLAALIMLVTAFTLTACGHSHEFSETWENDATKHWHACTVKDCDATTDNATHTFVDKNNATQYWLECSVCGYQQEKINATVDMEAGVIAKAVQFKDAEGNDYTNWEAEKFDNVLNKTTTKIKFTGNGYYRYIDRGISSEPLEGIYLNFNNDGVKTYAGYERSSMEDKWLKISGPSNYSGLADTAKNLVGISGLSESPFDYNEADNTYRVDRFSASSSTGYALKFANSKLVSVHVKRETSSGVTVFDYSWTISYGNTTIETPNDSEVITTTRLLYITSQSKFALADVTLNAGETKWFVIDITSTMFSGNTTDIQVAFTASESATLPTLTIEAEKNGTAITNDSATNGIGYFEGLSTGKCYIKITASENCAGSLSVVFG